MEASILKIDTLYHALKHILLLTCTTKDLPICTHSLCNYLKSNEGSTKLLEIVTTFFQTIQRDMIISITRSQGHPLTYNLAVASNIPHHEILYNMPQCTLFTIESGRITLSFSPIEEGLATLFDETRYIPWQADEKFTSFDNRLGFAFSNNDSFSDRGWENYRP